MRRLFLLLLLLAVATDADLRARATPYVQWALDPLYGQAVRWRLRELAGVMARDAETGQPLPTAATLAGYLASRGYAADDALDPWGEPLYLERAGETLWLGSAGPDLTPLTPDDVRSPAVPLTRH